MKVFVTPQEFEIVSTILAPYGDAWIFGSRVWGSPKPFSDLDIALTGRPAQLGALEALREALDESNLPFVVDVCLLEDLPSDWQSNIQKNGVFLPAPKPEQTRSN